MRVSKNPGQGDGSLVPPRGRERTESLTRRGTEEAPPVPLAHIDTVTGASLRFIKTMLFKLTGKRLVVPCRRAWSIWIKIPEGIFRRVLSPIFHILCC